MRCGISLVEVENCADFATAFAAVPAAADIRMFTSNSNSGRYRRCHRAGQIDIFARFLDSPLENACFD